MIKHQLHASGEGEIRLKDRIVSNEEVQALEKDHQEPGGAYQTPPLDLCSADGEVVPQPLPRRLKLEIQVVQQKEHGDSEMKKELRVEVVVGPSTGAVHRL
mmetsp:Transcript_15127/g.22301  ORF Transcript_15127/g.22301 Transcript_15127/m.22301 type:complete len:101 (+) Transcript_15127:1858-2160(+)